MSNPIVSVVMGVYNGADFLQQTIASILSQQGVELELIVIDDGSTDESESLVRGLAKTDQRVVLIKQENQGLTRALIAGCNQAKGKYIARQDVADFSDPYRLKKQLIALQKYPELSFVSCWTQLVGPDLEFLQVKGNQIATSEPTSILSNAEQWGVIDGPSHHGSVMFRTDAYKKVGGYRPQFYYGQDWDLWYRLAECGKFLKLPELLYTARILPDSISSRCSTPQQRTAEYAKKALDLRVNGQSDHLILKELEMLKPKFNATSGRDVSTAKHSSGYYFIAEMLRRNNNPLSKKYFKKAIGCNMFHFKSWFRLIQASVSL